MKVLVIVVVIQAVCATVVSSFGFTGTEDCPEQGVPGTTLKVPDPNDCSAYSVCLPLFGFKLKCTEGKHFSVAAGKCQPAAVAGCDPAAAEAVAEPQVAPEPAAPVAPAPAPDAPAPAPAAPAPAALAF
ncbi:nematocyst expressed protein 3-like [Dermacentor albipictus]|uniref:nematocyst expressed protein 3-like n=1 Tax=Dermacentor albipictus TaxID=60249 RepID=UPI0038FCBF1C